MSSLLGCCPILEAVSVAAGTSEPCVQISSCPAAGTVPRHKALCSVLGVSCSPSHNILDDTLCGCVCSSPKSSFSSSPSCPCLQGRVLLLEEEISPRGVSLRASFLQEWLKWTWKGKVWGKSPRFLSGYLQDCAHRCGCDGRWRGPRAGEAGWLLSTVRAGTLTGIRTSLGGKTGSGATQRDLVVDGCELRGIKARRCIVLVARGS